jgi:hypothetical protein
MSSEPRLFVANEQNLSKRAAKTVEPLHARLYPTGGKLEGMSRVNRMLSLAAFMERQKRKLR